AIERVNAAALDPVCGQLAAHYDRAGLPNRAIDYCMRAAEVAQHVYANEEAIGLLNRAVALLDFLAPSQERDGRELAILTALGVSLVATRGYGAAEVIEVYQRSHELSRQLGKPLNPPVLRALAIASI